MENITTSATRRFRIATALSIGIVLILIAIGGIVRATGSGMGCPDWPKCFGYIIPPSDVAEIEFRANRKFEKGNMIIHNEALWKAKHDFVATETWNPQDWEKYTKHNYAIFNYLHTWTEYFNRLAGALTGLVIIWMFICSLPFWKSRKILPILSFLSVLLVGFEGWLGKIVVDTNLKTGMITIHMVVAMILLMLLIGIRMWAFPPVTSKQKLPKFAIWGGILCSILLLFQIVLGTQVREEIDLISTQMGDAHRGEWVSKLGSIFLYHENMYFVLVGVMGYWIYSLKDLIVTDKPLWKYAVSLGVVLLVEILFGILLANFALPAPLQPLHLVAATAIMGLCFAMTFYLWQISSSDSYVA